MTSRKLGAVSNADDVDLMALYGIIRLPADQFRYGNHIYATLAQAIAKAKRDEHLL